MSNAQLAMQAIRDSLELFGFRDARRGFDNASGVSAGAQGGKATYRLWPKSTRNGRDGKPHRDRVGTDLGLSIRLVVVLQRESQPADASTSVDQALLDLEAAICAVMVAHHRSYFEESTSRELPNMVEQELTFSVNTQLPLRETAQESTA